MDDIRCSSTSRVAGLEGPLVERFNGTTTGGVLARGADEVAVGLILSGNSRRVSVMPANQYVGDNSRDTTCNTHETTLGDGEWSPL